MLGITMIIVLLAVFYIYSKIQIDNYEHISIVEKTSANTENESFVYTFPILDIVTINSWRQNGGFYRDLTLGSTGTDVFVLEKYLMAIGTNLSKADNYFGTETQQVISDYQKQNLILPSNGEFSGITKSKIYQDLLSSYCPNNEFAEENDYILYPIDRTNNIQQDYVPPKLTVLGSSVNTSGIICLRGDAAQAYTSMYNSMKEDGLDMKVTSGYRRYELQDSLYDYERQSLYNYPSVAMPGHSEHQLGVAVDLAPQSLGYEPTTKSMKFTKEYQWLSDNAHLYGFVLSYPEGLEYITGYTYEPWHWRYVGIDAATNIYNSKITPVEYLKSLKLFPNLGS